MTELAPNNYKRWSMPVREQKPFPSLQVDLSKNVNKKFFTKIPKIPEERTIIEVAGKKYSKEELEETLRSSYEKIEMISNIYVVVKSLNCYHPLIIMILLGLRIYNFIGGFELTAFFENNFVFCFRCTCSSSRTRKKN